MFAIRVVIALTSVIAIFGCWGSMNNSYSAFSEGFRFWMIFYAMTQIFEINLTYVDENFNKYAELVLFLVGIIAKFLMIRMLLYKLPKNKRAWWYFFTAVNNYRTENDYDDFKEIFDDENGEAKRILQNITASLMERERLKAQRIIKDNYGRRKKEK
jgi:hypothetical protein